MVTGAERAVLMEGALIEGAPCSTDMRVDLRASAEPLAPSLLETVGEWGYVSSSGSG